MEIINMHQAKTHLSRLAEKVQDGEEVIIAKAGKPLAKLVAFDQKKQERKPGYWKNKVKLAADFDKLPKEFLAYFK